MQMMWAEELIAQLTPMKRFVQKKVYAGKITLQEALHVSTLSRSEREKELARLEALHLRRHKKELKNSRYQPIVQMKEFVQICKSLRLPILERFLAGEITYTQARYASNHRFNNRRVEGLIYRNKPGMKRSARKRRDGTEISVRPSPSIAM